MHARTETERTPVIAVQISTLDWGKSEYCQGRGYVDRVAGSRSAVAVNWHWRLLPQPEN